ncbi:division/cell wall cluster transcriptional repressor MraZ [Mariprofundus erugo]|uniref:division/cell wall cluster transcriptional repressor MraZ n=1 Tax=Mariprofundus erugo TaxID=2528639 RepID=UPI0010FE25E5|nr:division/cell wall cluster transcriptional repressor MraZ [Mariprofundus erugo]TLS77102.1 division/cell wall cluster transcriptional repressor MraZ [Mariprofundus erugo]
MFQGEFSNNMDDKGRVSIPAAFRDALNSCHADNTLIVARSHNSPNLVAYPMREWKRLLARVNAMQPSKQVAAFRRAVIGAAQECVPDRQGRVLLSPVLREHASLSRAVHFAGTGELFEIWDSEAWSRQLDADLALLQDFELGL